MLWTSTILSSMGAIPAVIKLCFALFVVLGVALFKFFDSAGSVDQLLLAGEKRMAGGADFNVHFLVDRTQLKLISTGADSLYFMVLWMYISFHISLLLRKKNYMESILQKSIFQGNLEILWISARLYLYGDEHYTISHNEYFSIFFYQRKSGPGPQVRPVRRGRNPRVTEA